MFEERRLFGAAATVDSAELYARIDAACNDHRHAADGAGPAALRSSAG
jgi:hypothetical protein